MRDLISRQDAIDALQEEINKIIPPFDDVMGAIRCGVRLARNIIEDLPCAEPECKTGKWHILDECANEGVYCSECRKKVFKIDFSNTMKWKNFRYCPNCGSYMGGIEIEDE